MRQQYTYFPLFMKMKDQKVIVFGAGTIAARRVGKLLQTQARITVIAPELSQEMKKVFDDHPSKLTYIPDIYHPGCLKGEDMDYVFAATDDEAVNGMIARECRHREIYVNNASDHQMCDFYFPATIEAGDLMIAIASNEAGEGTHTKTKVLREKIEQFLGEIQ